MVSPGRTYGSSIRSSEVTDSFSIFLPQQWVEEHMNHCRLDRVRRFLNAGAAPVCLPLATNIGSSMRDLAGVLSQSEGGGLAAEEALVGVTERVFGLVESAGELAARIDATSPSTRVELLRRVSRVRDLLDARIQAGVSLAQTVARGVPVRVPPSARLQAGVRDHAGPLSRASAHGAGARTALPLGPRHRRCRRKLRLFEPLRLREGLPPGLGDLGERLARKQFRARALTDRRESSRGPQGPPISRPAARAITAGHKRSRSRPRRPWPSSGPRRGAQPPASRASRWPSGRNACRAGRGTGGPSRRRAPG
jgi:hypothetical protein